MTNHESSLMWYPGHGLQIKDIQRAENCHLYDAQGKRYVDLESGIWCTSVGHTNPRIIKAITSQLGKVAHTGYAYSCEIVEQAARVVLALHGFEGGKCVLLCSGSEAVEYMVCTARMVSSRPKLMVMDDSYYGAYGRASSRAENDWFSFNWFPCTDCSLGGDCDEDCPRWASIPFEEIAGFLFEPGSSSGRVRFPPRKLIENIVRKVQRGQGLVMVNEVTTGIGRTGAWFGYQHYDISPQLVAMGKGLGNGYPVSATVMHPSVIERLGDTLVKYAQSHQNDPLGAAAALEVIRTIQEEGLIERSQEVSSLLLDGLEGIKTRSGRIKEVRGRGLMIVVELDDPQGTGLTARVHAGLVQSGFLLARPPGSNVLRMDPALTIESADIEAFLTALEYVLAE